MRESSPPRQLAEVVQRLDLARAIAPFTRCLVCNDLLEPVGKTDVLQELPPRVREGQETFRRRPSCRRVYLPGSHHRRMEQLVAEVAPGSEDHYESSLRSRAILMRVAAARGESARAIRVLRADLAKVEAEKNRRLAFETALALGDVELKAGRPEGRTRLLKLEQEAKTREFFRIARLAREALDRKLVASAAPRR